MSRLRFYQDTLLWGIAILLVIGVSFAFLESLSTRSHPLKVVHFFEPQKDGGLLQ